MSGGHEPLRVLVGSLGPGELPVAEATPPAGTILLDLGPDHPSNAGLLELRLWTADGVITQAEVVVGAMHRGAEKLFEVRDYRQILMLADRHDWQAPFSGELLVALAAEHLLGLEVPLRTTWLRTLMAEHTRVLSHLGFLRFVSHVIGRPSGVAAVRERLRDQTLRLSGNRIHPMINRVGGLSVGADAAWLRDERELLAAVRAEARTVLTLADSVEFGAVSGSAGRLSAPVIHDFGVSGPAARASGVGIDLRLAEPYLGYPELIELLTARRTVTTDGTPRARFQHWAQEVLISADLIEASADRLYALTGPVAVPLGKIVKLPEGETYLAIEAPLGMAGCFLVSRGEKTPWRLKLRTPSFANVAALETLLIGVPVADLAVVLASMGYVVGDIDR